MIDSPGSVRIYMGGARLGWAGLGQGAVLGVQVAYEPWASGSAWVRSGS